MSNEHLHSRADGETLRKLPSGVEIVRRRKHEPIDASSLSRTKLEKVTRKEPGSKFVKAWNLQRVVDFTARQVELEGWTKGTESANVVVCMKEIVGIAEGKRVRAIKIVCYNGYVHAYPVES